MEIIFYPINIKVIDYRPLDYHIRGARLESSANSTESFTTLSNQIKSNQMTDL